MEERHVYFMQRAIALAQKGQNTEGGGPFGAVIVKNNQILAQVFNKVKGLKDCTGHAEILAIQQACKFLDSKTLEGCTLYTSCEPCIMCLGATRWAKLETVYYGASGMDAKKYGFEYSNLYFNSSSEDRHKEFNLKPLLGELAIKVWEVPLKEKAINN